jgi:hypothetical protein
MPETATSLPPSVVATFASLLSGLASPKPAPAVSDRWDDDALGDDISTLSYEQALRSQTRYRSSTQPGHSALSNPPNLTDPGRHPEPYSEPPGSFQAPASQPPAPGRALPTHTKHPAVSLEESRKSASITIRLSPTECDQLRERAADAGLTVSAYLRSCVFEVESLRAQVKDTLAQLRTASVPSSNPVAHSNNQPANDATVAVRAPKSSFYGWLLRLFVPWHRDPRLARA